MWWEKGELSFQAKAFLEELMKFASIIIFNLGAKFSLHCIKSWCCDATKEHMSPQLSLQHHYIIHKYQSQIKSPERGLHQSESTKKQSIYGTQSPWQLQICPPISQEGEKKNPSLLSQKALAKLNSAGGCKEPYQPWAARTTAKSTLELIHSHMPPLLSVGSSERENVGKRGNGSETTLSPGLASSPVSTPCPSTADAAGPIQLESRPWAGERTTLLAPQKASPKNKMRSHSSPNPWL